MFPHSTNPAHRFGGDRVPSFSLLARCRWTTGTYTAFIGSHEWTPALWTAWRSWRMPDKVALIIGVTGQDGDYLSELFLSQGYVVHGLKRRSSSFNTGRIDHLYQDPHDEQVRFR